MKTPIRDVATPQVAQDFYTRIKNSNVEPIVIWKRKGRIRYVSTSYD